MHPSKSKSMPIRPISTNEVNISRISLGLRTEMGYNWGRHGQPRLITLRGGQGCLTFLGETNMDVTLDLCTDRVRRLVPPMAVAMAGLCAMTYASEKIDFSVASLFDAQRNELVNTWGGTWQAGSMQRLSIRTAKIRGERLALAAELGPLGAGEEAYMQCLACGFGRTRAYCQTRDLARYSAMRFNIANDCNVALDAALQVKDYRDNIGQRAVYHYDLPAKPQWRLVEVPLSLAAKNWTVEGLPDLSRVLTLDFTFVPKAAVSAGRVYLENIALVERGGPLDVDSSPLRPLVERLAHRQWDALWAARSRDHGLIPNNSYQSTDAGLNCTAAVLWMLPTATRRHWVAEDEANRYVARLVGTIDRLLDESRYVPPRNVDWVTLKPSLLPEESAVDAAFMALALHQYKSLLGTPPALRAAIDRTREPFQLRRLRLPAGLADVVSLAGPYGPAGFVPFIYDGYTNEGNVISLAAHLDGAAPRPHRYPLERRHSAGASAGAQAERGPGGT